MTYRVDTAMGTVSTFFGHPLDFLTKEQKDEFDNIGYTGKTFRGDKVSRIDYLNSLELGMFSIEYIKRGNGDFKESFVISRSFNDNESHIQFCVAYAISERKGKISNHFENFEDEEKILSKNSKNENERLY